MRSIFSFGLILFISYSPSAHAQPCQNEERQDPAKATVEMSDLEALWEITLIAIDTAEEIEEDYQQAQQTWAELKQAKREFDEWFSKAADTSNANGIQ